MILTRRLWFVSLGALLVVTSCLCADTNLRVRRIVGMEYPHLAKLGAVQGYVLMVAEITSSGTVDKVRVLEGHALLSGESKNTLRRWLFEGCKADRCEARLVFSFVIEGQCEEPQCTSEFIVDLPNKVRVKSPLPKAIID